MLANSDGASLLPHICLSLQTLPANMNVFLFSVRLNVVHLPLERDDVQMISGHKLSSNVQGRISQFCEI